MATMLGRMGWLRVDLGGSDGALKDKGAMKRSREDPPIQSKSPRLGKHVAGEEGPELIGILDHSTHTFEFSMRRTMKGL